MTDWLIEREEDRAIVAGYNGHMCAGKREPKRLHKGRRERELEEETQRWTDKDLKETGNGFTFTTHFALRLTFGGEQMCRRALGSRRSRASLRMNMEQAQLVALAGSFPTERQIFSPFFTSPLLWKMRGGGRQKLGLLSENKGAERQDEEHNHSHSMTAGGSKTGDARCSPVYTTGMVEIMRSAARKSPCDTQPCILSVFSCSTGGWLRPDSRCHWLQQIFA